MLLPSALLHLLTSWASSIPHTRSVEVSRPLEFQLRHHHAVSSSSRVVFSDSVTSNLGPPSGYHVEIRNIAVNRPRSRDEYELARMRSLRRQESVKLPWEEDEIIAPDVSSRETLLTLAKMTNDAYVSPGDAEWYDLGGDWNVSYPFGWEPDSDGFRGHVFATADNSTVVMSIKGTSAGVFGGGGPTVRKDKLNDNLLFSCCCARVDWTWTTVCGCYSGGWRCDIDCLQHALIDDSLFYPIGTNLYNNLTYLYPNSNIWVIGHSLGGALASLLGATFGLPVVTFESPGERMAASRLHLPMPPSTHHITHVYHTADPIAMGTCNGVLSSCAIGGYAMESRCHLGLSIIYDTVQNKSWGVDIRTHGIVNVIEKILSEPWPFLEDAAQEVPAAVTQEEDCVECYSWEFGHFQNASAALEG